MLPTGATDCGGEVIIRHEETCVESGDRSRLHHLPFYSNLLMGDLNVQV